MQRKELQKKKIIITLIQLVVIGIVLFFTFKNSSSPLIDEMFGNFDIKKGFISFLVISIFYLSLYIINRYKGKK